MISLILAVSAALAGTPASAFDGTHAQYNALLAQYVQDGLVDYQGLKENRANLDAYLSSAGAVPMATFQSWSKDELMEKGKSLYETKCAACHQITGTGLPPAFPPLKGSPIATGPIGGHLQIVLNGKAGTAMQAWNSLNDLEIAAIITYERNAWGNDTGDIIQPADVKNAR